VAGYHTILVFELRSRAVLERKAAEQFSQTTLR
jgi:hypothetical protein